VKSPGQEELVKLIVATIQVHALTSVEHALLAVPRLPGLSVTEIRGFGQGKAAEPHSPREQLVEFTPKLRLEIAAPDADVPAIAGAIRRAAHTGSRGDGKILVVNLAAAIRICAGEQDEAALASPTGDRPVSGPGDQ